MKRFAQTLLGGAFAILSLSCWVPERFVATLNVNESRQYQFTYEGTLVFSPALDEIGRKGALDATSERQMQAGVAEMRKSEGFVSAEYVGRGRARVVFRESGQIRSGTRVFMDLVEFQIDPKGQIHVKGANIDARDHRELRESGLNLDGTIRLTTALKVVEHNAESTPWFGGLFGSYKWHVGVEHALMPTIVLR